MFALPTYSLRRASEKLIKKSVTTKEVDVNGTVSTVEAIEYTPEERRLFYKPIGQHKL
jgi:hypothetical protein